MAMLTIGGLLSNRSLPSRVDGFYVRPGNRVPLSFRDVEHVDFFYGRF